MFLCLRANVFSTSSIFSQHNLCVSFRSASCWLTALSKLYLAPERCNHFWDLGVKGIPSIVLGRWLWIWQLTNVPGNFSTNHWVSFLFLYILLFSLLPPEQNLLGHNLCLTQYPTSNSSSISFLICPQYAVFMARYSVLIPHLQIKTCTQVSRGVLKRNLEKKTLSLSRWSRKYQEISSAALENEYGEFCKRTLRVEVGRGRMCYTENPVCKNTVREMNEKYFV